MIGEECMADISLSKDGGGGGKKREKKGEELGRGKLYLVTGGTGFVGYHLVNYLLGDGHRVRIISRKIDEEMDALEGVESVAGSITSREAVLSAAKGVDAIFHLAGVVHHSRYDTQQMEKVNIQGTMNIMTAAALYSLKVVYASTSGVVGCSHNPSVIATDDSPYATEVVKDWPYYASKIKAEKAAIKFAKKRGVELVCMRPTMMIGPGDRLFRSTHTVVSFLDRKIPIVPEGGAALADVRDVALACVTAMYLPQAAGKTYLLGGKNVTMAEYFSVIQKVSGVAPPFFHPPPSVTKAVATMLDIYARKIRGKWEAGWDPVKAEMANSYWYIHSHAAERDLGYKPRDFQESVKETVDWIRNNREKYGHPPPSSAPKLNARLFFLISILFSILGYYFVLFFSE